MIVDDRHGDPVVGHAFGECEREHEEPDEEGARLSPGREGTASLDLDGGLRRRGGLAGGAVRRGCGVVVVVLREESCRGDDDRRDEYECSHYEVHGDGHPAGDHRRADQCTGDSPQAEAGVEPGHDGSTELLLDEGPVHVDRHVPRACRQPEEEQADHDRCDPDPVSECHDQQCDAEQNRRDGDRPARSEASDHRTGQRQGEERTDGDREQDQAECGRFEVKAVPDLRDPRRPRGDGETRPSKRHVARDHCPFDPAHVRRDLDGGGGCHRQLSHIHVTIIRNSEHTVVTLGCDCSSDTDRRRDLRVDVTSMAW